MRSPSFHVGLRIASALDVDPHWLADGEDGISKRIAELEKRLAKVGSRVEKR